MCVVCQERRRTSPLVPYAMTTLEDTQACAVHTVQAKASTETKLPKEYSLNIKY